MQTLLPKVRGSVSQSIYFEIEDAAAPFQPKTGLAFNTAGIAVSYQKTRGARVAITPVDLAGSNAAWTSGGLKEVDAANMPGVYRLDLPDAALADDGAVSDEIVVTIKATGFSASAYKIPLVDKPVVRTLGTTVKVNS